MSTRILSGARPTGALHLGHYVGALKKYGNIQDAGQSFFLISDLHFLTTRCVKSEIEKLEHNSIKMVIDSLAIGMSADKTNFYLQSCIPEIPYIYTIIQNMITVRRVMSTPSLEIMSNNGSVYDIPFGLLGYPILEAGDIIAMQADAVVVGRDNIDHIDMTREIVNRLNSGFNAELKVPELITDEHNFVVGLDGKYKMSKSLDNAIFLSDSEDEIERKISKAPWHPYQEEGPQNAIIQYIEIFEKEHEHSRFKERFINHENIDQEAREYVKMLLNRELNPIREKISIYSDDISGIKKMLAEGTENARGIVANTLQSLQSSMGLKHWIS